MQSFDEDMGELFRKASTEIRLKPLGDDWDKIKGSLLPDPVFLPATESMVNIRNSYREVLIAFFLVGIIMVSSNLLRDHQTNKMVSEVRSEQDQIAGSDHGPVTIPEKSAQKLKTGHVLKSFKSFTSMPAKNVDSADRFEYKSLSLLTPVHMDWWIQVGFGQTPGAQKIMKNHVDVQKELTTVKRIYGGIIAGPQCSQTNQQGFGNAGLSAGLIAGFHLNKKVSIETGFVISDKQFSSSGEYFDMSKISVSMPSGMKLLQIHSMSTILEIPFNVNYEVFKLKKGGIFATGGVSSYIIASERNQYQASVNGINETFTGNYPSHQSYFAATANMGLGYEWNAGNGLNLRVNPYLQIPLKTIGMGSMPVVSAGIYLGILFPIIK